MQWIQHEQVDIIHERFREARSKHDTEGRWILSQEKIENWMTADHPQSSILWLNGSPGAGKLSNIKHCHFTDVLLGKTVAASVIIDACRDMQDFQTAYFYCDEERSQTPLVLRTLLAQLLGPEHGLMPYIWDRSSGNLPVLRSANLTTKLLQAVFETGAKFFLIVDGIDECDLKQRQEMVSTLTGLVTEADGKSPGKVRLLIVSQEFGDIRKCLSAYPSVTITAEDNEDDIRRYVNGELQLCKSKFALEDYVVGEIRDLVVRRAAGVYPLLCMRNRC